MSAANSWKPPRLDGARTKPKKWQSDKARKKEVRFGERDWTAGIGGEMFRCVCVFEGGFDLEVPGPLPPPVLPRRPPCPPPARRGAKRTQPLERTSKRFGHLIKEGKKLRRSTCPTCGARIASAVERTHVCASATPKPP